MFICIFFDVLPLSYRNGVYIMRKVWYRPICIQPCLGFIVLILTSMMPEGEKLWGASGNWWA
jgi:hypothetical protein